MLGSEKGIKRWRFGKGLSHVDSIAAGCGSSKWTNAYPACHSDIPSGLTVCRGQLRTPCDLPGGEAHFSSSCPPRLALRRCSDEGSLGLHSRVLPSWAKLQTPGSPRCPPHALHLGHPSNTALLPALSILGPRARPGRRFPSPSVPSRGLS